MSEAIEDPTREATEVSASRTFLFADIRGYTPFTKQHGGEQAARLAFRFNEVAHDAIAARGGWALEIRGDQVLAEFTHAENALYAAVEMQQAFAEEATEVTLPAIPVGIGLDRGEAVAGPSGYHGAVLNQAARLCSAASAGEVLTTTALREFAGELLGIRYESRGSLSLKGLDEPVDVIAVVADDDARPPFSDAPERSMIPVELDPVVPLLAGREEELHWLRGNWRIARRGHGRVLSLIGARGSGKTHLCGEFARGVFADGGHVLYVGRGALSDVSNLVGMGIEHPTLVIADNLDPAGQDTLDSVGELAAEIAAKPVLIVCSLRDEGRDDVVLPALVGTDTDGHRTRRLGPLDDHGIRLVASIYVSEAADEVPLHSIRATTGGMPGEVHEAVSRWARERARRRLQESATRLRSDRSDLDAIQNELASSVADFELVEERARLLDAERADPDDPPFKGLASFDVGDAKYFFGRERLVGELAARIASSEFIAVLGPSGSGKSSVMRAGLLPALDRGVLPGSEGWRRVLVRPGAYPLTALTRALGASAAPGRTDPRRVAEAVRMLDEGQRLLIVVDQLEEIFTSCSDSDERRSFVDELLSGDGRVVVVVAMRADYYGRCTEHPRLASAVSRNHILVGPMREDEVRAAIEMPARRAGLWVDPELGDLLVTSVVGQPGGLPLLSSTLLELWIKRSDRSLRMESYEAIGGIEGAIARLAESAFAQLTPLQQSVAKAVLLRLAGPGEGDSIVRRSAGLSEFDVERDRELNSVLDVLTDRRLLTVTDGTVEVAHEALLREWPRLRGWLEEDRHGRELHRHLIGAAREWDASGRDAAELYRGARLSAVAEWAALHDSELNELERSFLTEGLKAQEEARRRATRRLRYTAIAAVAVATALSVVAVIAIRERNTAREQRRVALSREIAAGALAEFDDDPQLGLLLAREAVRTAPTDEAVRALRTTLAASNVRDLMRHDRPVIAAEANDSGSVVATLTDEGHIRTSDVASGEAIHRLRADLPRWTALLPPVWDVVFTSERDGVAAAGGGRRVQLWDLGSGERVALLTGHDELVTSVALSPDARSAVTTSDDGTARVWDTSTGEVSRTLPHGAQVWTASFTPDGARILTGGVEQAHVWDPSTGKRLFTLEGHGAPVLFVRATSDGSRVVTSALDNKVRVWDLATGRRTSVMRGHTDVIMALEFSPDGSRLITGGRDSTARVWDVSSGRELQVLEHQQGEVRSVAFDDERDLVATAGSDQLLRLWDARTGTLVNKLRGHSAPIWDVTFVPGTGSVVSASADRTARRWDALGGQTVAVLEARSWINVARFNSDGSWIVAASDDGTARLWDTSTWAQTAVLRHGHQVWDAEFTADGKGVVSASLDRTARRWDIVSGREMHVLRHPDEVWNVVVSPVDPLVVTGARDGIARVWNESGETTAEVGGHGGEVEISAFKPDGSVVATAGPGRRVLVWNPKDGEDLATLTHEAPISVITFSSDNRAFLTASEDGDIRLWDTRSWDLQWRLASTGASISAARFTPDGRRLVTAGEDGIARVWEPATGEIVVTLRTSADAIAGVDINSDGTRVVTAGDDGTAQIWDVRSGQELVTFEGHADQLTGVMFDPDGELILTSSADATARVWRCEVCGSVRRLLELADQRATRALTEEERSTFLHVAGD